jgi:peptide chain release factor 3
MEQLLQEISRRRTFAIISHPDAGKTTITEKLLYHGGVIRETGEVKGKQGSKAVTSDWMELERQKGISITSSVMTFEFNSRHINLLDTPGHKDFSEDTYRVLMAVDSACMLIDVAKGVEERTKKLYEVCRYRKIPVITFINKCDREGKEPLLLIDEVEKTLQMSCFPVTWPIGLGGLFWGIYHRFTKELSIFTPHSQQHETIKAENLAEELKARGCPESVASVALEELGMIEELLPAFDQRAFLAGEISPVLFGSAKQNIGVDLFLNLFSYIGPATQGRKLAPHSVVPHEVEQVWQAQQAAEDVGRCDEGPKSFQVAPESSFFSGFVFKIQANMDRRHRDRMVFIRICSGAFERGMKVFNSTTGKELRLSYSSRFLASDKETVDRAYAGDIIGVADNGNFAIGDSVSTVKGLFFGELPRFTPELFARVSVSDGLKRKKLQDALIHLSQEGAIQLFYDPLVGLQDPILGAVGELQFEVLQYRLEDEYALPVKIERLGFSVVRWPQNRSGEPIFEVSGVNQVFRDMTGLPVVLLNEEWDLRWLEKENPTLKFASSRFEFLKQ